MIVDMSTADFRPETPAERAARIDAAIKAAQATFAHINPDVVWPEQLIAERRAEAQRDLDDDSSL